MTVPVQEVQQLVEHLFRHQAGQMLATLSRVFGLEHLDLAEEVVQDALVQALRQWPYHGIPANPAGWLVQVARNRALDVLRRNTAFRRKRQELEAEVLARTGPTAEAGDELGDDELAMVFACCHPALAPEARVALTLKAVGGFSVAEIARAFLTQEATVAQRIVRAKRRLQEAQVRLTIPTGQELTSRLDSVLQVLYLMFNEGHTAHQGEQLVREDLCEEAVRLAYLLLRRPELALPKVHALLALMLLQAARLPARVDTAGNLLRIEEQDRRQWDQRLLHRGLHHLERSAEGEELTEYHLQAGIAAVHAVADCYEETDWRRLLALYDQLLTLAPSPVAALNRVVVVAMVEGPEAGLQALAAVEKEATLRNYYLLPATRADLLRRLGRTEEAARGYTEALAHPCSEPERRFLLQRLRECQASPPPAERQAHFGGRSGPADPQLESSRDPSPTGFPIPGGRVNSS